MSFSRNAVIIALIIFHPCKKLSVGHLLHHTSIFERLYPQIVLSYIELHTLISNSFFFFVLQMAFTHLMTTVLPSLRVPSTARVQSLADVVFGKKRHVFYAYLYLFILTSCICGAHAV